MSDALEEWEPERPAVGIPELDLDRDWILDTERGYLEQLNAYRRHGPAHRDTAPLVLSERLCGCGCGRSLAPHGGAGSVLLGCAPHERAKSAMTVHGKRATNVRRTGASRLVLNAASRSIS